jgi:SPP1 gp7 family putative phage head morphogenesis protein
MDSLASLLEHIRRRIVGSLTGARRRRRSLLPVARQQIEEVTPLLARTLRDAQLAAFLESARKSALELPIPLPPRPPINPPPPKYFPTPEGDPEPVIRFPQIERSARWLATRLDYSHEEFKRLDDEARTVAFTVARVQTDTAVRKVREAIAEDVIYGGTLSQFREGIAEAIDGSGLSVPQVEAVYRTQTARAYSAGQIEVLDHPMVAGEFPYLMYSATHDSRARHDHLAMEKLGLNGTAVYRRDDPVWDLYYPPWGWGCRCIVIPLTIEDAAARGVREAREWLRSGRPPSVPEWVRPITFAIPKGWIPTGRRLASVA